MVRLVFFLLSIATFLSLALYKLNAQTFHPISNQVITREVEIDFLSLTSTQKVTTEGAYPEFSPEISAKLFVSDPMHAPIHFMALGVVVTAGRVKELEASIGVRISKDGITWSNWIPITEDADTAEVDTDRLYGRLVLADGGNKYIQYAVRSPANSISSQPPIRTLRFVFIDPGETATPMEFPFRDQSVGKYNSSHLSMPPVVSRTAWGSPDGQSSRWRPEYTTVSHLIVHHTGEAAVPSFTDYAAWVRAIWSYHTVTLGWGDIGYNHLIDPNGTVYEGRAGGDNVIGAHFSCQNGNTMGVALLSNFTSSTPTNAALTSLKNLLAWKVSQRNLDPLSTAYHSGSRLNLSVISGHKDGNPSPTVCNTSTVCPGNLFYALLPSIRTDVSNLLRQSTSYCVGCGAPSQEIANKIAAAYNLEGPSILGQPTNNVTSFSNNFYSTPISGYYQDFRGTWTRAVIDYLPGASAAYSVKYGFSQLFYEQDSQTGQPVYRLMVAPTSNEARSGTRSAAGTDYTWQPFMKGSMYFFNSSPIGGGVSDWKTYTWGYIWERHEREGGRSGNMGLPLWPPTRWGEQSGWIWWYQWFEKGFVWHAVSPSGDRAWTYAYTKNTNIFSGQNDWNHLGWFRHR